MKWYITVSLCILLTSAAMTVAGPTRQQRAADDTDNSIDVDSKSEDITNDGMIAEDKSDPQPTDLELTTSAQESSESNPALTLPPRPADTLDTADSDESDEEDDVMENASSNNGGSSIFSLLNLVGQIFPGGSGSNARVRRLFQNFIARNPLAIASIERYINGMINPNRRQFIANRRQGRPMSSSGRLPAEMRRQDISDNEIEIDEVSEPSSEEETEESNQSSEESKESEQSSAGDSGRKSEQEHSSAGDSERKRKSQEIEQEDGNTAAEDEVVNGKQSDEDTSESGGDYDEPPGGGDGGGGGILGVIAGLSGGEDGQSDLGSLLATVSGIVVQLSGDGVDVNGLIASGLGLFVGLLSEGTENPGSVVAGYINTALDTLSGGGSKNNGAFFGNFAGKILRGISMPPEGSEEGGHMKGGFDSAGFFLSLLMSFSGASSGKGMEMGEE